MRLLRTMAILITILFAASFDARATGSGSGVEPYKNNYATGSGSGVEPIADGLNK